jgi:hypothetical protein
MVCWSSDVLRGCGVETDMVVEVLVEATMGRVERGGTAVVVGALVAGALVAGALVAVVVGAAVESAGCAVPAVEVVA